MNHRLNGLSPQRTTMLAIDVIRDFAERLLDLEADGSICELDIKVAVSQGGIRTYRVISNEIFKSLPKVNVERKRQNIEISVVNS